jgi:hypothetical protein
MQVMGRRRSLAGFAVIVTTACAHYATQRELPERWVVHVVTLGGMMIEERPVDSCSLDAYGNGRILVGAGNGGDLAARLVVPKTPSTVILCERLQ